MTPRHSRDAIALYNNISTGAVSNIINEWSNAIGTENLVDTPSKITIYVEEFSDQFPDRIT
jgi:hypothetical protein